MANLITYRMVKGLLGQRSFQFEDRTPSADFSESDLTFFDPGQTIGSLLRKLTDLYGSREKWFCSIDYVDLHNKFFPVDRETEPCFRQLTWVNIAARKPIDYDEAVKRAKRKHAGWGIAQPRSVLLGLFFQNVLFDQRMRCEELYAVAPFAEGERPHAMGFMTSNFMGHRHCMITCKLLFGNHPGFPSVDEAKLCRFPLVLERMIN